VNTNRNYSKRYGSLFQTNFDRLKGLYGCPILNDDNKVIGIHHHSTLTTSYELKIDYINNILSDLINNRPIKRGDLSVSINLILMGIAKINYKLNENDAKKINEKIEVTGGPPELMVISSVYPTLEGKRKTAIRRYHILYQQ